MKHTFKKLLSFSLVTTMMLGISTTALATEHEIDVLDEFLVTELHDYVQVGSFSEGLAEVNTYADDRWDHGFINSAGQLIVPQIYDSTIPFKNGLSIVEKDSKFGCISINGDVSIPLIYDHLDAYQSFSEGLVLVANNTDDDNYADIFGFVNTAGDVVIPLIYDSAEQFSEGLASVQKDGKSGFINADGDVVIPLIYDSAWSFYSGLAAVEQDGKWGFINMQGDVVIPFIYEEAQPIFDGLALVKKDEKYGYINKDGDVVIPFIYHEARSFYEGMAIIVEDGKHGYINTKGDVVIPVIYDSTIPCYGGITKVKKDDKWGFVNTQGEIVVPIIYDYVDSFTDEGIALVKQGDKYGFINTKGELISPVIYEYAESFSEGLAVVKRYNKCGYINVEGQELVPLIYDQTASFSEGLALVRNDGIKYLIQNPLSNVIPVPILPTRQATPTASKIIVNGTATVFDAYNIDGSNYFKLRDIASVVTGTGKQFSVTWDAEKNAINLLSQSAYTRSDGDMTVGDGITKTATMSGSPIYVDSVQQNLTAYTINGSNYFMLRDVCELFDIGVNWNSEISTIGIDTSIGYTE